MNIEGRDLWVDAKLLLKLLAGAAVVALVAFALSGNADAKPTVTDKRAASFACQRAAIPRNNGLVLPSATCACNAKVGLPEVPSCKALRKGGR